MATDKISRLDNEAREYRDEKVGKYDKYTRETNEYSGDNDAALTHDDDSHPHGKGTGYDMQYTQRNLSAPKDYINHGNVRTDKGGGSYDKFGTKGVDGAFQGDSGREFANRINIYNKENSYGKDSVDIDTKVKGQFIN